jgi:hypothetical protein
MRLSLSYRADICKLSFREFPAESAQQDAAAVFWTFIQDFGRSVQYID